MAGPERVIINARIDDYVLACDAARDAVHLTNGEQLVIITIQLAGLLRIAGGEALTLAIGFVLQYVKDPDSGAAKVAMSKLAEWCGVDIAAHWRQQ